MASKLEKIEDEVLIDADQVEAMTGLKAVYQGKARRVLALPHYKIGARCYYRISEVRAWIKNRRIVTTTRQNLPE